jgi:hypothetical protein
MVLLDSEQHQFEVSKQVEILKIHLLRVGFVPKTNDCFVPVHDKLA